MIRDACALLATDESRVYGDLFEYAHKTVNHLGRQYIIGAVHTNTIEGLWSIFKRGMVGSFHKVSRKMHGPLCCRVPFRYNNRENAKIFGTAIGGS